MWKPISAIVLALGFSSSSLTTLASPRPQVIELYQSQGCSSCPPANAILNSLADRRDLLTLSFSVTYWDYLGWTDRFAKPAFTQRQYDYAATARRAGVQTPQMVINGQGFITGLSIFEVNNAVSRYARKTPEPQITASKGVLNISAGIGRGSVWLVRYDLGTLQVPVGAGENAGRTLPHRHIVRDLIPLGNWNGAQTTLPLPTKVPGLADAILVQNGKGGAILAAATL